ncbi:glucosamine-6-phosphate deaminase [Clostridium ihumii]|uniref:glucosamine-6-phosphate deaminase n=1 Tax=Clostridium ihumii TaxID=1470356 RepID=UPI000557CBCD|nr:glucosamine-6-phosphate deaminase [Clostridium ihumii]
MNIIKLRNYREISFEAAKIIRDQVLLKPQSVIGFATGSTPIGTYEELINIFNKDLITFENVKSFNLDEYYGINPMNKNSYNYFMKNNLFNYIDIKEENINIPNGLAEDVEKECEEYERKIHEAGGIDLQLLGIGRNGHIGFNEPCEEFKAHTHLVELKDDTIKANSRFFDSLEDVPTKAISMGVKTIMSARKIILIASGEEKAEIIRETVYGSITPNLPASILQLHDDVTLIVDEESGKYI